MALTDWLRHLPRRLSLFPNPCLLCGQSITEERLCTGCTLSLPYLERAEHICEQCALPLESEAEYCGRCLAMPPPFERCRAALIYDHPIDHLIHQFKYHRHLTYGRALSRIMAESLLAARAQTEEHWPDVIVPVPMHWSRRLRRGFNHTELLSADVAKALGVPMETGLCYRKQRTPAQQGLSRAEREQNLHQAFALSSRAGVHLRGRRVALVDDVVTTTSTAREISRLLLKAGAREVEIWALARTAQNG